ncbi:hypothetical protein HA466_0007120 [Hirschfeldia incana]|nr:hypothetical protein HA466_0007120 [Hirschfeldia incana]
MKLFCRRFLQAEVHQVLQIFGSALESAWNHLSGCGETINDRLKRSVNLWVERLSRKQISSSTVDSYFSFSLIKL